MAMTTEQMMKLISLLGEVAVCAPWKQGQYSVSANIPWSVVHKLRAELEAAGIDWQRVKTKYDALVEAEKNEIVAKRYGNPAGGPPAS